MLLKTCRYLIRTGGSDPATTLSRATGLPTSEKLPRSIGLRGGQMPFSAPHGAYTHNEEPSLDQILNEPIIRLLMARDGVEVETLRALLVAAGAHGRP